MTDTAAAPIVGVEGDSADGEYDAIIKQLDGEGFEPIADQDDPDQQREDDAPEEEAKITLKVNGKNIQKTQAEVVKMAQLYSATEMRLETAKKEVEDARATKAQLQEQQNGVRNLMGIMQRGDIDKISEFVHEKLGTGDVWDKAIVQAALKLYEISKMSPEQREALENRKLVSKLRAEAEERTQTEQQRAFQYQQNQWSQHIDVELPKAISLVGLPNTPYIRDQILREWSAALNRGQLPTAAAVANYVKKQLEEAKMLGQTAPKMLVPPRPRATKDSVGLRNGKVEETGYLGWDEWKRTRGN